MLTFDPFSPPSWSLSFRPHTNTFVLTAAVDSAPDAFFRTRLGEEEKMILKLHHAGIVLVNCTRDLNSKINHNVTLFLKLN